MLTKESKIRVLENFYALDYVFFGKSVKEMESCCLALVEDYMSVKGAVLSVLVEMYKLVGHMPEPLSEKVNTSKLMSVARQRAKVAREMCHKLVASEKGRADIKTELREAIASNEDVNINKLVENAIRTKAFCLACDHLLIATTISESINYEELNEWSGRIIEDSYKILRDSLVENAILITNDM